MTTHAVGQGYVSSGKRRHDAPSIAKSKHDLSSHYKTLVRQVLAHQAHVPPDCLCVGLTSCTLGEGVTTTAINLALTAARQYGRRVLLVDATSEQGGLEYRLGLEHGPGLMDLLSGRVLLGECVLPGPTEGLSVLGNGSQTRRKDSVLDLGALCDLVEELRTEFDLVVFDMSHAHETSDCFALARILDAVLLVLEAGRVDSHVAQRVVDRFNDGQASVIGTVLSKCK